MTRTGYPSDVSDEEWAFVAPYLTLMREDAPQRAHALREVFNGLRYIVRTGVQWRYMPNDLPPWHTVYQQTQRWAEAGVFEAMVHDLRAMLRLPMGSTSSSSSCPRPKKASSSCPGVGSSNAASAGWHASGVWCATMNAWRRR